MNTEKQKGLVQWPLILGAIILLGVGIFAGRFLNTSKPESEGNQGITPVPSGIAANISTTPSETSAPSSKGKISGYLIYPSDFIPEKMGVCAQKIDNPEMTTCTNQIKDKKYINGVGYELNLDPGNYYVYSFLGEGKAYYTEFVLCGLKVECKSHTKIPVVVTAGSNQENILPHDWYDSPSSVSPTATGTPSSTVIPTVKPTLKIVPIVSIKLEKEMIKILPTSTPVPIPTIKIVNPIKIPKIEIPGF